MIIFLNRLSFLFLLFILVFCSSPQEKKNDTPISGTITLYADESFQPIVKAQTDAFEGLYHNSRIETFYKSEGEAIKAFLNGDTDIIIIGRELNNEEREFISKKNIVVNNTKVATDALTFLVNSSHKDSVISTNQLKNILNGNIKTWNQLSSNLPDQFIEIVLDKNSSSNLSYLFSKWNLNPNAVKIYAAGSHEKVLEYIKNTPYSLGVIGANWISDEDDPLLKKKLSNIRVLALGEENKAYYQPTQANLTEGFYPLTRSLYIINKNVKTGLGTGFASFVLSDQGQRIVLKSGLLPAVMPGREIQIK